MDTTVLTSAWEAICLNFFPIFTQPTAQNFLRLATGWILCTTRRTISAIFPFADPRGQRAHDAYHRLFPKPAEVISTFAGRGDGVMVVLGRVAVVSARGSEEKRTAYGGLVSSQVSSEFSGRLGCFATGSWRGRINCMFGKHSVPTRITEFLIDALAPAA